MIQKPNKYIFTEKKRFAKICLAIKNFAKKTKTFLSI